MGRTSGHQRGDSVAAYGEVLMATVKNDQIDAERIVWVSLSTAMRVGFGGKTGCGGTAFSSPCV